MKKRDKKGSHVSFIISFALFISFLIFFIGIIKPFEKAETGKEVLLKHLEKEIIKEISADVLVVSAMEKQGGSKSCENMETLIENKKNIFLDDGGLIKIYISNELALPKFSCNPPSKYEIGLVRNETYVLKSKVLKLNKSYEDYYDDVKENFKIPETNDFEFSFLNSNKETIIKISKKEIPQTEVLAELIPVVYLTNDAEIKNGYIKVVLW